jgi:CHASE2 domain-containing sensor protein
MLLFILILLLAAICTLPTSQRKMAFLLIITDCLFIQAVAAGYAHLWLPGIPALAATLSAVLFSYGKNIMAKFRALFLTPQPLNFQP